MSITSSIKEITVKSFSWAMGVRKPGFLLVSLWNPVDAHGQTIGIPLPTVQHHLCLLPDQLSIFIDYAFAAGATLLVLLVRAVVLALRPARPTNAPEEDQQTEKSRIPPLPRWRRPVANGSHVSSANGYATGGAERSNKATSTKGRHRASSTSLSHHHSSDNEHLSVQRSYNARTRSVSPAAPGAIGGGFGTSGAGSHNYSLPAPVSSNRPAPPLIEKAGYFSPTLRWLDPEDSDETGGGGGGISDEESNIGSDIGEGGDYAPRADDTQAKWKRRRRTPGRARRAWDLFVASLAWVGIPSAIWYLYLIRTG